jgi:hypothetical protein
LVEENYLYLAFSMKHRILALCLLFIFAAQWVAGVVYVKVTRSMEINRAMNELEQAISAEMTEKHDIQSPVEVLEAAQMQHLLRMGYGTPYLFYHGTAQSAPVYFTLTEQSTQTLTYEQAFNEKHYTEGLGTETSGKILAQFFPDLALPEALFTFGGEAEMLSNVRPEFTGVPIFRHTDTTVPPPWFFAGA